MEIRYNLTGVDLIKVLNFAAGERDDEKVLNYARELTESTETNEKENNDERPYKVVKTNSQTTKIFGGFSNDKRKELIERAKEHIKEYEKAYVAKVNRKERTVEVRTKPSTDVPLETYVYPVTDHVWNKHIMKAWGIAAYRGDVRRQRIFGTDAFQPHDVVKGMEVLVIRDRVCSAKEEEYKKGQVENIMKQETEDVYAHIKFKKNKRTINIHPTAMGRNFAFIDQNGTYPYKIKILSDTKAEYGGDEL